MVANDDLVEPLTSSIYYEYKNQNAEQVPQQTPKSPGSRVDSHPVADTSAEGVQSSATSPKHDSKVIWTPKLFYFRSFMYGLLTLGLNFSTAFVVATLIPIHVMEMVGSRNKEAAMTVVAVIGAILPSFAGILTGYLSDHKLLLNFHNRYGKRKPFIMAGVLMWVVSIMLRSFVYFRGIGTPQNQFLFVVYNLVTTIGFMGLSIAWVPYNALMQDVFPKRRFGVVSGISGFLGFIGNSLGLGLIGLIFNYVPTIILCSVASIVVTVTMIAVLIFVPEKHVEAPEPEHTETKTTVREKIKSVLHVLKEFFTPFKDWDFAWIFIARFVILFTLLGMQNYFLYYMQDVVGPRYQFIIWDKLIKNASEAQAVFLGIVVFSSMISSVVGGALSDRVGRKYVVCGAGLIAALALLAIIPAGSNFNLMCIIAIFLGVACGSYLAVDLALINEVVADKKEEACKMIGVFAVANNMASILASPVVGGLLLIGRAVTEANPAFPIHHFGYVLTYGLSGVTTFVASIMILFMRKGGKPKRRRLRKRHVKELRTISVEH